MRGVSLDERQDASAFCLVQVRDCTTGRGKHRPYGVSMLPKLCSLSPSAGEGRGEGVPPSGGWFAVSWVVAKEGGASTAPTALVLLRRSTSPPSLDLGSPLP